MSVLKRAGKTTAVLFVFLILWGIASINGTDATFVLAFAGLLLSAVSLFRLLPALWINSRVTACLLAFLSLSALADASRKYEAQNDEKLAILKKVDPAAYLSEIKKAKPDSFYMNELLTLAPELHKTEVFRRSELAKIEALKNAKLRPSSLIEITDFSWSKEGFGTVMTASFTIANNNPFDVKDLVVKCTHSAPSGTEIDSSTRTIYEVIPSNKKRVIRNFNMGFIHSQISKSSCDVTSASLK